MSSPNTFKLEVQELSRFSNAYQLEVKWFTSIKNIKDMLNKKCNCPPSRMRLYHSSSAKSLSNQSTLHDLGIYESGQILRLVLNRAESLHSSIIVSKDITIDPNNQIMLSEVRWGLQNNRIPAKTDLLDSTGGVYFMRSSTNNKVAVFKPSDEEQGMYNNPKGHAGDGEHGLRPFFKPGQGYIREMAAYILDYGNFADVPATTIVHCEHPCFHYANPSNQSHSRTLSRSLSGNGSNNSGIEIFPKIGSLQQFVRASEIFEDISASLISTFELQKIALLDIRLLNNDRNSANILACRKNSSNRSNKTWGRKNSRSGSVGSTGSYDDYTNSPQSVEFIPFADEFEKSQIEKQNDGNSHRENDFFELIPIDHGYCIPSRLQIDEFDWAWYDCPQISKPIDPEIKHYLLSLDIEKILSDLTKQLSISEDSLFLLRISHMLLVEGVSAGMTLRQIASFIVRTEEDKPSQLETLISAAEENAYRAIEIRGGRLNGREFINSYSSPARKDVISFTKNSIRKLVGKDDESDRSTSEKETEEDLSNGNSEKSELSPTDGKLSFFSEQETEIGFQLSEIPTKNVSEGVSIKQLPGKSLISLQTFDNIGKPSTLTSIGNDTDEFLQRQKMLSSSMLSNNFISDENDFLKKYKPQTIFYPTTYSKKEDGKSCNTETFNFASEKSSIDLDKKTVKSLPVLASDNEVTTCECSSADDINSPERPFAVGSDESSSCEFETDVKENDISISSNEKDNSMLGSVCRKSSSSPFLDTLADSESDNKFVAYDHKSVSSSKSTWIPGSLLSKESENKTSEDNIFSKELTTSLVKNQTALTRVVSLAAFSSPPIYDISSSKDARQLRSLRKEKRKSMTATTDYMELRVKFAGEGVQRLVHMSASK